MKATLSKLDDSTIDEQSMVEFDRAWNSDERLNLVPGKETLTVLNSFLQTRFKISITGSQIVASLRKEDVPEEMVRLIDSLEEFRRVVGH